MQSEQSVLKSLMLFELVAFVMDLAALKLWDSQGGTGTHE